MDVKKKILIAIAALTIIASVVLLILGKGISTLLFFGGISYFLIYALWNPINKKKNFGYFDAQRAMRAFDRTDMLKFTVGSGKGKKKKKKKLF